MRTWSTHTVELADVLARMYKMLWCACRLFIGATIYGVFECPTFAVCLWVVHLEPHLLDNTGPLTRDTAVRRGVSLSEVYPLLCQIGMRHRGLVVCIIVQRGDVRFLRDHRDIREKLTCISRHHSRLIRLFLLSSFSLKMGKEWRWRKKCRRKRITVFVKRCDCSCPSKTDLWESG